MSHSPNRVNRLRVLVLLTTVAAGLTIPAVRRVSAEERHHVWQKVEIVLEAENDYADPYREVEK